MKTSAHLYIDRFYPQSAKENWDHEISVSLDFDTITHGIRYHHWWAGSLQSHKWLLTTLTIRYAMSLLHLRARKEPWHNASTPLIGHFGGIQCTVPVLFHQLDMLCCAKCQSYTRQKALLHAAERGKVQIRGKKNTIQKVMYNLEKCSLKMQNEEINMGWATEHMQTRTAKILRNKAHCQAWCWDTRRSK